MRMIAGCTILVLAAGSAQAQEFFLYGGAKLEFRIEEDGPGTGNNTFLSTYLEAESNGFYAGLWGRVVNDELRNEVDVYVGYRNETAGGLSYDFGYTRYIYPNDGGDCCGEVTASFGLPVGEKLTTSLDLAYDPVASLGNAYVEVAYAVTDAFEVSANYGVYEVDAAPSEREWDLGLTYYPSDETALDLRYYDGSEYVDSYIGISLSWDTTLLSR
jgi:hypothetical protein